MFFFTFLGSFKFIYNIILYVFVKKNIIYLKVYNVSKF